MAITDPTDRSAVARAFARTYTTSYADPWDAVEDYYRVRDYAAANPSLGSTAVATALDLPRSRIRPWMNDGSRPDPVRGLDTLDGRGWLDLDWNQPPFTALNALVAWVFSGGSIAESSFVPLFTLEDGTLDPVLETVQTQLGVDCRTVHEDDPSRATECQPAADATVLGRLLCALGAPVGEKATADLTLPAYLDRAPDTVRLDFARVYIRNRGVERPKRPNRPVAFREERSAAYIREFVDFLADVVGDDDWIRGSETSATKFLTPRAAAVLCAAPTLGTDD